MQVMSSGVLKILPTSVHFDSHVYEEGLMELIYAKSVQYSQILVFISSTLLSAACHCWMFVIFGKVELFVTCRNDTIQKSSEALASSFVTNRDNFKVTSQTDEKKKFVHNLGNSRWLIGQWAERWIERPWLAPWQGSLCCPPMCNNRYRRTVEATW